MGRPTSGQAMDAYYNGGAREGAPKEAVDAVAKALAAAKWNLRHPKARYYLGERIADHGAFTVREAAVWWTQNEAPEASYQDLSARRFGDIVSRYKDATRKTPEAVRRESYAQKWDEKHAAQADEIRRERKRTISQREQEAAQRCRDFMRALSRHADRNPDGIAAGELGKQAAHWFRDEAAAQFRETLPSKKGADKP